MQYSFLPIPHLALALTLVGITPALSWAQQPSAPNLRRPLPFEKGVNDLLANDARLNRPITLHRQKSLVKETLQLLRDMTLVPLQPEENPNSEVSLIALSYRYKNVPLRDVLDSIAALHHLEWRRKGKTLLLCSRHDPHALDPYHPQSEAEAVVFEQGRHVLDWFNKQTPEVQQQLQNPPLPTAQNPVPGFAYSSLPGPMQNALGAMTSAVRDERVSKATDFLPPVLPPKDLSQCVVTLKQKPDQNGVHCFDIHVYDGHTDCGMPFNILPDSNGQNESIIPFSAWQGRWYGDKEAEASRQEALQTDPRLNANVTLKGARLTMAEALNQLALQTSLSFTADNWEPDPVRKSFDFVDRPLKEVLTRLGALYGFPHSDSRYSHFCFTWGECKSGVFVIYTIPDMSFVKDVETFQLPAGGQGKENQVPSTVPSKVP